ncbi:GGDEF domain-containing protein [Ciceribacter sp. RN22]|uniref:GGDEF domain-containing protein n=1 Tax=Ciceribacter sp. RN22 TaxID=2954932 RepID=UPI00209347CF|nr:GGDEF domain-containing protein [Ciceribacter sp. RN22]MCO6178568.1 GGDEF domain-containing protein [Ciceribacter sp. RN22]
MATLFHVPTLMACLLAIWVVFAVLLTMAWSLERQRPELAIWSVGFWLGALGALFLSLRTILPEGFTIGLGNGLLILATGLAWLGIRAFDGLSLKFWVPVVPTVIWFGAFLFWPGFREDVNARIALVSVIIIVFSVMFIRSMWQGEAIEPLPSRKLVMGTMAVHGVINAVRLPLVVVAPVMEQGGIALSAWHGVFTFEIVVNTLFCGMALFSLGRERVTAEYKRASQIDALTGVFNRRAFSDHVDGCRRRGVGGAIALLDLDHFKRVNDTYGHGAGDKVLCAFVAMVQDILPQDAVFGRLGGEEFAVYLPARNRGEAHAVCERLRRAAEALPVDWKGNRLTLTVSIGLCGDVPAGVDLGVVLGLADRALYAAKRNGRNRIAFADGSEGQGELLPRVGPAEAACQTSTSSAEHQASS